ncbi:DUF6338 family protein [Acidiphilium cryptum]|uniref:Uncharacterized protein n=1 Tax=Acidiphilium cryptum (strain JF-5) TaxID=349163 RepID=A5FTB3_ACICJ|nr:DUF6338 family protein [Acidiphilium cryptum]ABQ28845.1 hypothetical protein Acry_3225 [Acidiphilium cryptum JF-5]
MDDVSVNLFLVQVAVIFLPGIIWAKLDATYAAKVKPSEIEFVVRAFVFGLTVYVVEYMVFEWLHWPFPIVDLAAADSHEVLTAPIAHEVLGAVGISLIMALLWLYASTYKLLTRFLQLIKATKKYGDEDVWDFMLNSGEAAVEYAHVRDLDHGFLYAGWVDTFSETDKLRELVLLRVIVYNLDGEQLYETPRLYLARAPEKINIEFPHEAGG